jgi:Xaa-Pro aminopeptidase
MRQIRPFSEAEYAHRRARAVAAARDAGLDALLVVSRGGGTSDRHGNLVYLANAYTAFPFIPDHPPSWSGRGHAFLLLPCDGDPELLLDVQFGDSDEIAVERVRVHADVIPAVVVLLRAHRLERGRIGLVGSDVLPVKWYWEIERALPDVGWSVADELVEAQRRIKSPAEQDLLREVARRGVAVMHSLLQSAQPGRTKGEVMGAGLAAMAELGLLPYDLRLGSGTDLSQAFLAHLPGKDSDEVLGTGELFRIDVVASLHGYYVDFARTCIPGGGPPTAEQRRLLRAARDAVYAVLERTQPGVPVATLAAAGMSALEHHGLAPAPGSAGRASGFSGFGHSIGVAWEAPWLDPDSAATVESGMCLAVEKKVGLDGVGAATFEEMVLVTDGGIEILTEQAPYAPID